MRGEISAGYKSTFSVMTIFTVRTSAHTCWYYSVCVCDPWRDRLICGIFQI